MSVNYKPDDPIAADYLGMGESRTWHGTVDARLRGQVPPSSALKEAAEVAKMALQFFREKFAKEHDVNDLPEVVKHVIISTSVST